MASSAVSLSVSIVIRPGRGRRRPAGRVRWLARPRPSATGAARPRPRHARGRAGAAAARRPRGRAGRPCRPPRGSRRAARRSGRAPPRSARGAPASRRAPPRLWKSPSRSILPKETGPLSEPRQLFGSENALAGLDVRRLQALVALHHVEFDRLTFGQRLVAIPCNRREVDEDVFAAFALDEAVALLVREPLDGALGQVLLPSYNKQRRTGHRAADLH